jgi:hypothetical protein
MKKIVIVPTFCESHLIRHQIPNIIDTIDPDYIIYNEGMFPNGTEGNKLIDSDWLEKYTLDGQRGFDYLELENIIRDAQEQYPKTKIILNKMSYTSGMTSTDCFIAATTNFKDLNIDIQPGDFIFPFEADVFHHENSKQEIEYYMSQLTENTGFRSIWIDFIENQYYVEKLIYSQPRSRRVCIKFGTWDFYLSVLSKFMHEHAYTMLYPTDLITYHYCWWRPGKFKQLRFDQLQRDSQYWPFFNQQLAKVHEAKYNDIKVRYNRNDSDHTAYIAFTSQFDHPSHVKTHECWSSNNKFLTLKTENYIDIA